MKLNALKLFSLFTVVSLSAGVSFANPDMSQMPKPIAQHQWLQQFVGHWTSDNEIFMEPGKPAMHTKGTETIRPVGGFWTLSEVKSTMGKQPFNGVMTLGYSPEKQKYIGTWVDSMTSHMWQYEGTVDSTGKVLTLYSEGACPMRPNTISRFKETIELVNKDHKVFKSFIQLDDGQWMPLMSSQAHRKH